MMFAVATVALAFNAPMCSRMASRSAAVSMNIDRRDLLTTATVGAATLLSSSAAFADGANSRAVAFKARAVYGSRVVKLLDATSTEKILDEKNVFQLFVTGTYRTLDEKATAKKLNGIAKTALAAAGKGDLAGSKAAIKEFVAIGKITDVLSVSGNDYDPKQRRNPGAPETSEIEAGMASLKYAFTEPKKTG
mmetsp:Transcript_6232/g.10485  ORF Transcript_6232/g.10485 Transcript_6232/m.10485 type:complete len:192 (+) Transcript_6232:45-620(+)|eukprot:CAMPEP_0119298096 /NCGR_PEP_ID=MMETSP1333-20130426/304_1 /TAXON_ID=418940 /ORGANISM="Scyphosphaera apsteinii, Strain RCC1455" /LENGTH=191 /DNA_ID=CAMNT_0007299109 /DNA_START=41 /DNA_END=616 /DNA_ORIENTATION=-